MAPCRPRPACAREHFLQQHGLSLARIESIWYDDDQQEFNFSARWYYLPEETYAGRQRHHAAREVFLSQLRDDASVHSILGKAGVLAPEQYNSNARVPGVPDDDVYFCEYEYDCVWQRFRRRGEWNSDSDDEWAHGKDGGKDSDDEERDMNFRPVDDMPHLHQKSGWRGGFAGGPYGRKHQGGDDLWGQVGALNIPEHVRQGGQLTTLVQARDALRLAASPKHLPCREHERRLVERFVEDVVQDGERKECTTVITAAGWAMHAILCRM